MTLHPAYSDDETIRQYSVQLLNDGHSVFQLLQFPGVGEQKHSLNLLGLLAPPLNASILSLGCGVGGMERYWKLARPDLSFELVNISQAQLDLCLCAGNKVLADANTYSSAKQHDAVVIAYALGHLDRSALKQALRNVKPGGFLMLFDIFDVSDEFKAALHYSPPTLEEIEYFGADNNLRFTTVIERGFHPEPYMKDLFEALSPGLSTGGTGALFTFQKAG